MAFSYTPPTVLLFAVLLAFRADTGHPQSLEHLKSDEELHAVIASLDASLFDSYNRCEIEKFVTFFDPGVEFYHDQTGLAAGSEKLAQSLEENI